MENKPNQIHNPREKSIAFLNQQAKVSNFAFDLKQHQTKQPSELDVIKNAQIVSEKKDNYKEKEQQSIPLQSGPAKKYIDQQQKNTMNDNMFDDGFEQNNNDAMNTETSQPNQQSQQQNDDNLDDFVASGNEQQQNKTNDYDAFFDAEQNDNGNDNNNNNNQNNQNNDNEDDLDVDNNFLNTDKNINDESNVILDSSENNKNEDEKQESENTTNFLTVWQEQHRKELLEKAKKERESHEEILEKGRKELAEFNKQRTLRIEQTRKDAKMRENDLREDYNAVFKHGTIWQQVAKLVDLQSKQKSIERMRDLLIILKNEDEKKSEK